MYCFMSTVYPAVSSSGSSRNATYLVFTSCFHMLQIKKNVGPFDGF